MTKIISKTREILEQMRKDNKLVVLNDLDGMAKINAMNEVLEKQRREYQVKEANSCASAKEIILNA